MNLVATWQRFQKYPAGKTLFSLMLGRMIPYSNTIHARIEELDAGHSKVVMRDRRAVRNHLNSVHAVALMNLAELTSGLAMVGGLPSHLRGILVGFRMEYFKKARGTLTAEARCSVPNVAERQEQILSVDIKNDTGGHGVSRARDVADRSRVNFLRFIYDSPLPKKSILSTIKQFLSKRTLTLVRLTSLVKKSYR